MSYTLIKGSFHIHYPASPLNGPEPDGDTLKFQPDDRALIAALPKPNRPASFNRDGITSIRFEGIDALETHFDVGGDEYHQNLELALVARDALLAHAGFGAVTFFATRPFKVETVRNHPVRGYILSNGLDTYGRTIAFAFAGDHAAVDGTRVFVTPQMLDESLNLFMLREGHAYAAFYLTLPAELRAHLREVATAARRASRGLWPQATATTDQAARIGGLAQLQQLVLWPKLFRRLAPYFQEGYADFAALDAWLRQDPRNRDDRLLLPNLELGNMHDLIVEDGDRVRLAYAPEDVVIVPDDFVLDPPVVQPPPTRAGRGDIRIVAALVDPAGTERGNETVTLLNTLAAEIDLGGWKLADGQGRQALAGRLGAGEALRVRLGNGVQLSNVRDTITVLDGQDQIVDQVVYEARQLPEEGRTKLF
jgi:endonuclease YncB( thermonuclease family)